MRYRVEGVAQEWELFVQPIVHKFTHFTVGLPLTQRYHLSLESRVRDIRL